MSDIYTRFYREVRIWAARDVRHGVSADDVTQVTIINLYRALEQDPDHPNVEALVRRIYKNVLIDHIRSFNRHHAVDLDTCYTVSDTESMGRFEQAESRADNQVAVMLSALPAVQREVMELLLVGYTEPQIAKLLAIKEANVRKLVYRARKTLRQGCLL